MSKVMVRYKVKPESVSENERLIGAVYEELERGAPARFRYVTFRLDDGVSFVHIASTETNGAASPTSSWVRPATPLSCVRFGLPAELAA